MGGQIDQFIYSFSELPQEWLHSISDMQKNTAHI